MARTSQLILNFHGVGPVFREIDDEERKCWLDQDFFEKVLDCMQGQPQLQLTFDDGNASDVEIVLPALLRRGLRATFFVCTGRLNRTTFLSRVQVHELQAHNMGIGSHGISHIPWCNLSPARLHEELAGSREVLEDLCGNPINAAACPFGAYDRTVLSALLQAGYRFVYTSDGGVSAPDHWLQARNTITRWMSIADVTRLIRYGPGMWKQASIRARQMVKRLR